MGSRHMPPDNDGLNAVDGSEEGGTLEEIADTMSVAEGGKPAAFSRVGYWTPACKGCEACGSDGRANG